MTGNTYGQHGWSIAEETIDRLPDGIFSVGVGKGIIAESGYSGQQIVDSLSDVFVQLIDGGANVGHVDETRCYFRRRGKAIDIGSRSDFEELGWGAVCDILDSKFPDANDNKTE